MRITKIQKAVGYRIFKNFNWPADLPGFSRFNVIYGWNGSGKTSLSNLFRHVQRRLQLSEGQVDIFVDETRVSSTEFATAPLPNVRVFNRDAVDRNIFELGSQQWPPVFFLGEDSVEKQKLIEGLNGELQIAIQEESRWNQKKSVASSARETFCSEEAKGIKNLLTVAGGGPYNNYNASHFKTSVQSLVQADKPIEPLSEDLRQQYLSTKDGKAMPKVGMPSDAFPDFIGLMGRTQRMLERSIVSSVIRELAENPQIANWVGSGLALHIGESSSNQCRFCEQELPEGRIARLEAHFNDEFKRFQLEIDGLVREVDSAKKGAANFSFPPKEALYESLRDGYQTSLDTLKQNAVTTELALDILIRALLAKRDEPFKVVKLASFITNHAPTYAPAGSVENFFQAAAAGLAALSMAMGRAAFERVQKVVDAHNDHTEKFDAAVKQARDALAKDEVTKSIPKWLELSKSLSVANENSDSARSEAHRLRERISAIELEIRQHRRPAEELTAEVASYLGRDELKFEVEQNGYRITRGGTPAIHLSDGERTAIAFLYFLKSLQGTDFDIKTGIVVIDDPVSSLDANSLFSAFGFMKQRTSEVGQLFVLTHNFAFFRQVRNWFYNLKWQRKSDPNLQPARFYMLAAEYGEGVRSSTIKSLDPFLHQYESEYHYLFKRVYEEANRPPLDGLETYYAIPNIARRLLESFLAFRVPDTPGELFNKLEAVQHDPAKKTRILRFLHTYSHLDQVAEPDHDPSVLSETPAILHDLLALIKACDAEHFECMERMVKPLEAGAA